MVLFFRNHNPFEIVPRLSEFNGLVFPWSRYPNGVFGVFGDMLRTSSQSASSSSREEPEAERILVRPDEHETQQVQRQQTDRQVTGISRGTVGETSTSRATSRSGPPRRGMLHDDVGEDQLQQGLVYWV